MNQNLSSMMAYHHPSLENDASENSPMFIWSETYSSKIIFRGTVGFPLLVNGNIEWALIGITADDTLSKESAINNIYVRFLSWKNSQTKDSRTWLWGDIS